MDFKDIDRRIRAPKKKTLAPKKKTLTIWEIGGGVHQCFKCRETVLNGGLNDVCIIRGDFEHPSAVKSVCYSCYSKVDLPEL